MRGLATILMVFVWCLSGGVAIAQTPLPADPQQLDVDLRAMRADFQTLQRTLTETSAELERTRVLAQSAWDGTALTLFGVLLGIALTFAIEQWRRSRPVALAFGLFAFVVAALVIRLLDDQLVDFMRWLVG
jgi:hypothetical protein